jgi:hypothetical protein
MAYVNAFVSRKDYFCIGKESTTGTHYISILVSNSYGDYSEYYEIDKPSFDRFVANPDSARPFVEQCKAQKMDHLLFEKPGWNRGTAG